MKTFEERYTAWIDGELEGNALVAFEQELERRATVSEAYSDKASALRLSTFLHDHLHAPTLTNTDFFNHQLRERIAGERAASRRPEQERAASRMPLFAWSLSRLAGLGAACLFISGALYYGMIPKQGSSGVGDHQVAVNHAGTVTTSSGGANTQVAQNGATENPAVLTGPTIKGNGPAEFASLTRDQQEKIQRERDLAFEQEKQQRERAMIEPGADIQARVPDRTVPATATPLHYKDSNVNVLWVNGLDYLPDASALDGAASPAAGSADSAPKATATP